MGRRLSVQDRYLLGRIAAGDVTWRRAGLGRSYRLWINEATDELVTRRVRRLVDAGLATCQDDQPGRGWLELTPDGHAALDHPQEVTNHA